MGVPIECSLGARTNTTEEVDDSKKLETSLPISADQHCECYNGSGPTAAVISCPSENYYNYYAKTVPITEPGNGIIY